MMKQSYRIFRIFGISVELHITFIFFFLLILFLGLPNAVFWLSIFSIVLLHELIHSLVALGFKIEVPRITLTPIGGLASIEVPEDPKKELLISIAGPMSNFVLAALVYSVMFLGSYDVVSYGMVLAKVSSGSYELLSPTYLLSGILWVNLILGLFNIIPGFPMDGGRVFRAVLAFWTDYVTATRIAVRVGQLIALIMVVYGFFANFWLVIIGLFLYYAGGSELKVLRLRHALMGLRVGDIAVKDMSVIPENASIADFLRSAARRDQEYYPVSGADGRVVGFLDISDLGKVDRKEYESVQVLRLARKDVIFLDAQTKAEEALGNMLSRDLILVKEESRLIGYITPERVFAAARFHGLVK